MSNPFDTVSAAREAVASAQQGLREAIVEAHEGGMRVAEIAEASGYTRQRIYQLLAEAKPAGPDVDAMTRRLAELDARYDALISNLAEAEMPADARREQLRRNTLNGKIDRAQSGKDRAGRARGSVSPVRGLHRLPTVRQEARDFAESKLIRLLEDRRGEPFVERIVAELDEAAALREQLSALRDAGTVFEGV